ncbi:phosphatidylglycerol lysyltransferase domain-containing protein [Cryobacterium sp. TmT2-59]|uniref:bifunctional lysylphosphatidylglycerol flippase/synthetase MprF n=1 Tax=Cryobacterium sp. TmT2-59 TaxID=1259264 RepID=UPI001F54179C|nr:phosphatidylglycerol lysyltransferase domain-containing protein [Cryobacterium sp. TmT2-59]
MTGLRRLVAGQPLAMGYALLLLAALVTGPLTGPSPALRGILGTGYESVVENGHWWSPLTSVFFVDNAAEVVLALFAAVVVLGQAERLMGGVRTAIAFVVTAVLGAGLGILGQSLGVAGGEFWSRRVSELWSLDPFTPIVGTIMAASFYAGPLWRRRIRVFTISGALVLLLYSGQPSDVYRLIAALVGLGLGAAFRPRPIDLTWRRSSHHETRTLLAAVVGVLAVGPLITIFSGARFGVLAPLGLLLTQDVPAAGDVVDRCLLGDITRQCVHELTLERVGGVGPVLVSLLPLVTLLVAAYGLARGRRFGAWLAIVVNAAMAVLGAWYYGLLPISGQPYVWRWHPLRYWEVALVLVVSVLVPVATAILIAANLRRFPVRSRPGVRRRFALSIVAGFLALASLYVTGGWLLRDRFRPTVTLLDLVTDVPERFIPVGFLRLERLSFLPTDWVTTALYQWVGPAFWIIVIVGAIQGIRSSGSGGGNDQARLRKLLIRGGGGGSLAFMTTWDGNSIWFSPSGTTAIAYRVFNGVAITTTEPVGPIEDGAQAIADFATMCDDNGWVPVFYSLHDHWQPTFAGMGWRSMGIGEETILRPRTWDTRGKKWQDIRSSINRADRAGVRAEWTDYRSLTLLQAVQISEISEQWVQEKELPELDFTLGGLDELRDPAVRLMLAIDADDHVHAVTSWLPSYRDGVVIGWTLDFMRRRPDSMNGVMEFLIAQTAQTKSERPEIEFLSLSAAPLARTGGGASDERDGSLAARVVNFLGRALEPVYGFQSLLAFKRKFQPEFHPLFMAYPDPVALPTIGLALARAYLPSLSMREAVAFARSLG